ncbi:MAG: DNA translocase FtsK [Thiomonas sp.]
MPIPKHEDPFLGESTRVEAPTSKAPVQGAGLEDAQSGGALYRQAVALVLGHRQASVALVQRHLRLGYNRTCQLFERMEAEGIVSALPATGLREILVPLPTKPEQA